MDSDAKLMALDITALFVLMMTFIVLIFLTGRRFAAADCEKACGPGRVTECGEKIKCREDK